MRDGVLYYVLYFIFHFLPLLAVGDSEVAANRKQQNSQKAEAFRNLKTLQYMQRN